MEQAFLFDEKLKPSYMNTWDYMYSQWLRWEEDNPENRKVFNVWWGIPQGAKIRRAKDSEVGEILMLHIFLDGNFRDERAPDFEV